MSILNLKVYLALHYE